MAIKYVLMIFFLILFSMNINGNGIIIGQAIGEVTSSSQQFNYQIVKVIKVKLNNTDINIKDNKGNVIIAVPKSKPKILDIPVELIIKRSISIPKDTWLLTEVVKSTTLKQAF